MSQPSSHSFKEPPPRASRHARDRQRGNTLVVALIALTGLATLGALTVSSVQGGISSGGAERARTVALLAAESGCGAGLDFLRRLSFSQYHWFSNNIRAGNVGAETPPAIRGNERLPGQSGNPFSTDMQAWYRVTILNNETDPNFNDIGSDSDSLDLDGRVFLLCEGHGPRQAVSSIMVEVQGVSGGGAPESPPSPPRVLDKPPYSYPVPPQNLAGLSILSWREVE